MTTDERTRTFGLVGRMTAATLSRVTPHRLLRELAHQAPNTVRAMQMELESSWPLLEAPAPSRIWIDVGAHAGARSLHHCQEDPRLRVYAFEPMLNVALQSAGRFPNYVVLPYAIDEKDGFATFRVNHWKETSSLRPLEDGATGGWDTPEAFRQEATLQVPTMRLDTFFAAAGLERVEFIKVDAQGHDLAVVRSLGKRIADVERIEMEVQLVPCYQGQASKEEVLAYLSSHGFHPVDIQTQSGGREENITFSRK